jgi:hypothetical protein
MIDQYKKHGRGRALAVSALMHSITPALVGKLLSNREGNGLVTKYVLGMAHGRFQRDAISHLSKFEESRLRIGDKLDVRKLCSY